MGRAPCCDKTKVKRGPWSPEEDNILKNYVDKHGTTGSWIALPHKAGLKRCGKSCRLRWLNYLRPNIKHGGFTEEEDTIIITLFRSIGSRWSVIASQLGGRTDNDVKNYWNTKLKKKLLTPPAATAAAAAVTAGNFITSTNNMDLSRKSMFDNSHEEILVLPNNAYECGFLLPSATPFFQNPISTTPTTSFCAEDEAFLVGWGSDELEGLISGHDQYDNFNFDLPNISNTTTQKMQTIYQSLAN